MSKIITIIQAVIASLLIISILIQQRGTGISGAFGASNSTYATRRGAEKVIFASSIVLAILFFALSITRLIL